MNLATYLTPQQFNEIMAERPIAYVPFGTVEWHGPHLPLGVDTLKIEALVERATRVSGGIVFPSVIWNRNSVREVEGVEYEGVENKCRHYLPGNIHFIAKDTFENLVKDIVETCLKRGFKVVCVLSGHNAGHLRRDLPALNEYFAQTYPNREVFVSADESELIGRENLQGHGIEITPDHAGKWETSIIMAAHPDLVDLSKLEGRNLENSNLCVTNNGVQDSNAELGRKIVDLCGNAIGQHALELLKKVTEDVPLPQPMPGAW